MLFQYFKDAAPLTAHQILLQRRTKLHMTQQQVADKAGVQLRQYQRLESGERDILSASGKVMLPICKALMLDPYLFVGDGNDRPEIKRIILPPIETQGLSYAIPSASYYFLVSSIPRGKVCADDDLMECLYKAYGVSAPEIKADHNSAALYLSEAFPYWRVVSQKGYLFNTQFCSRKKQKDLLEKDGVEVQKIGESESYRVSEFEYRKFDINDFKITVMQTEKQLLEQFKSIRSEDR